MARDEYNKSVYPEGYRGGTNYNTSVVTYEDLSKRIQRQLGAPLINLEVADEQIWDFITDSIEYFTKWAGYTEEYLIFDTRLYIRGYGIKVDDLVSRTPELGGTSPRANIDSMVEYPALSASPSLSAAIDMDLGAMRRVIDCFEFSKGEDTGINTLFTLEQAMAQQIYSSYMIGNFGFDLTTWEVLKGFIETRNKTLAMIPQFRFDPRTQVLKILPEPMPTHTYLGVVGCYIERPVKDLIRERWVQKYALALTKIGIARTREKFQGTNLMGGGSVNYQALLSEGLTEKEKLEQELMNEGIDSARPTFFIGVLTALLIPAGLCVLNALQTVSNTFCS